MGLCSGQYRSYKDVHDILGSFDAGTSKTRAFINNLNDGHLKLWQAIHEKKFLIIFDDVREGRAGSDRSIVIVVTEIKKC